MATTIKPGESYGLFTDTSISLGCKECEVACKHASCMDVCPTGAIIRTEFNTVFIQQDACNGCRNCIAACPYSVIAINQKTGTAHKCTLCYDRLQGGLEPCLLYT